MMLRLLKAERMKLRRSPVWLAFIIMPVIPALLGTINYIANIDILESEWYSLWTQHTLFTCYFFLPVMLGVYCSYIMRIEYNNNNWNKVLTMPVNKGMIFIAKLITVSFMLLISEAWIGVLFVLSGKIAGISSAVPVKEMIVWCGFGTLGGIVMAAIQLLISIFIKSFALPVGIAFGGGLSGLVFLAKGLGHIWPYSLMAYGMNSNSPQKMLENEYISFVIICVIYIAVITIVSVTLMSERDV